VYGGRFKKIPLTLAGASVALLVLLGVAVWGPWWGPQELARAQDVAGGSPIGLDEASDTEVRTARTKEDERGDGSQEGPEPGNLPEHEGQRSSEASTGSPKLGEPSLASSTAVLQGDGIGEDPGPGSEANAVPGPGPEQVRGAEVREGSAEEVSQEFSDAGHVGGSVAKRDGFEPAEIVIEDDPAIDSLVERGTVAAAAVSSGLAGQESGDGDEDGDALNADRPVVDEPITDPEVSPHFRLEQTKTMAQALAKGDPNAVRVFKRLLKGKLQEFHHSLAKVDS
jgi:hypothetical protein